MTAGSLTARLLSPAGFVLAGFCVFLPFGTVSCATGAGPISTTYTGAQLIGGAGGTLVMPSPVREQVGTGSAAPADTGSTTLTDAHAGGLRILLIAVLVAVLAGIVAAAIRPRAARAITALAAAVAALVMLVGAQISGRQAVETWFRAHPEALDLAPNDLHGLPAGVSIRPGFGFWASTALLIVVGAGSVLALLRASGEPAPDDEAGAPATETAPAAARPRPRMRA